MKAVPTEAPPNVPTYYVNYGSDPETFMVRGRTVIAPTEEVLKHDPGGESSEWYPPSEKLRVEPDGAQLEIKTRVFGCRGHFIDHLRVALWRAAKIAASSKARLEISPTVPVFRLNLRRFPQNALIAGCDPDFDAYTLSRNRVEIDFASHPFRYGGGHLHMSAGPTNVDFLHTYAPWFVRFFDVVVGLPIVGLEIKPKEAALRRRYFGRAGCFRLQPHGLEYRTPDNGWLRSPVSAFLVTGIWKNTLLLCSTDMAAMKGLVSKCVDTAAEIINEADGPAARAYWLSEIAGTLAETLKDDKYDCDLWAAKILLDTFRRHYKDSDDVLEAWRLLDLGPKGKDGLLAVRPPSTHGEFNGGGMQRKLESVWKAPEPRIPEIILKAGRG